MKKIIFILLGVVLMGCNNNPTPKENNHPEKKEITKNQPTSKSKIAILGTFHFSATNDFTSVQIDSLLSDKRQKELDELVDKIKEFHPTKIMVEWEPKTKTELDMDFKKYIHNDFVLPKNEIYQVAFRLAKKIGIKEFYPIDYQLDLGDEKLMEYLTKIDKFSSFENLIADVAKVATDETDYLKSHSITDYFRKMNSIESGNFNRNIYLEKLSSISPEAGNPLLEYVANWYKRNIFIMGLIDSHVQKKDRILVLIGAGHKPILKDLYLNRSDVEYVEIEKYLE